MSVSLFIVFVCLNFLFIVTDVGRKYNYAVIILSVIYIILLATRSVATPDTQVYIDFYRDINLNFDDFSTSNFEYGYQILAKITKNLFGSDYRIFFGITIIINIYIVLISIENVYRCVGIDKARKYILPLILYISYFGIFYNGIVLRAGLSMSFLGYATTILLLPGKVRFRYLKISLLFLIALSFHKTSIIAIPVFLLLRFLPAYSATFYRTLFFIILACLLLDISKFTYPIFFKLNDYFALHSESIEGFGKINQYVQKATVSSALSLKLVFFTLLGGLFSFLPYRHIVYFKYLNVYMFCLLFFVLSRDINFVGRGLDFFKIYSFILSFLCLKQLKSFELRNTVAFIIISCQYIIIFSIINKFML